MGTYMHDSQMLFPICNATMAYSGYTMKLNRHTTSKTFMKTPVILQLCYIPTGMAADD